MTTHTPYDAEWQKLQTRDGMPAGYVETRAKREGYLRALADVQPRMDALVAAAESLVEWAEVAHTSLAEHGYDYEGMSRIRKTRDALARAGKEVPHA